ncbi:MAG: ArnT family glycosyltransferase [Candidatus Brocadiales bacterium]
MFKDFQGSFWDSGYTAYGVLAINVVEGRGFRLQHGGKNGVYFMGETRAERMPLYPLFLSVLYVGFGKSTTAPVLAQSIIGTLTVLITFLIGRQLFNEKVGIAASSLTAIYPYYVVHDTALQETSLLTLLTGVSVLCLIKCIRYNSLRYYVLAGVSLGIGSLCKNILLGFVPFAVFWILLNPIKDKTRKISILLLSFAIVMSPWVIRNTLVLGKPIIGTTQTGGVLWQGNNPFVLSYYPWKSIDNSTGKALEALTTKDKKELLGLDELGKQRWYRQKAVKFMRENPVLTIKAAFIKAFAGMGWILSPQKDRPILNFIYTASYLPLLIFGIAGAILTRKTWREISIIYFLFVPFLLITMLFFAHTSSRVYLDIYLMVLAAFTLVKVGEWLWLNLTQTPLRASTKTAPPAQNTNFTTKRILSQENNL